MPSEQGGEGDICPSTSRTHSKHPVVSLQHGSLSLGQQQWLRSCGQYLDLHTANICVFLPSTFGCPYPQYAGFPVLSICIFPSTTSGSPHPGLPGPEPASSRGFTTTSPEDLALHCFSFYLKLSGQGKHVPRRGRESRRASCLQAPGPLSGVILEEEDNWSEIRATTIQSLISISPLNKPQHTPKKPNVALPAPASSISAPVTRCLDPLCLWTSLTDSEVFLKPRRRSTLNPLLFGL